MAAAMLSNQFREERNIDTLLRVDGIFPECLLLASVLCFFPHFFRDTSAGLGFTGARTRSFACIIKR
jgi:hypothetical protein